MVRLFGFIFIYIVTQITLIYQINLVRSRFNVYNKMMKSTVTIETCVNTVLSFSSQRGHLDFF